MELFSNKWSQYFLPDYKYLKINILCNIDFWYNIYQKESINVH